MNQHFHGHALGKKEKVFVQMTFPRFHEARIGKRRDCLPHLNLSDGEHVLALRGPELGLRLQEL